MSFFSYQARPHMALRGALCVTAAALLFCLSPSAKAQDKSIKKVPITQTDASSGQAMFASYCAACHGASGKGDGPAASEFKVKPADLTLLAKNNHGEFPSDHVWAVLHFGAKAPAHGTSGMPVWGELMRALEPNESMKQEQRIHNLVSYLQTIQAK